MSAARGVQIAVWAVALCEALLSAAQAESAAPSYVPIDLSRHITHSLYEPLLGVSGNDFGDLASGQVATETARKTLKGVPFHLAGVVLVAPQDLLNRDSEEPIAVARRVEGIPIGRKADRLSFLHAGHSTPTVGSKVGVYLIHYADGTRVEVPVRQEEHVRDFWSWEPGPEALEEKVAWRGRNDASSREGASRNLSLGIRLFLMSWKNPHPDREIKSLDVLSGDLPTQLPPPALVLMAVTAAVDPADSKN